MKIAPLITDDSTDDLESRAVPSMDRLAMAKAAQNDSPGAIAPVIGPPAEGQDAPPQADVNAQAAHQSTLPEGHADEHQHMHKILDATDANLIGGLGRLDPNSPDYGAKLGDTLAGMRHSAGMRAQTVTNERLAEAQKAQEAKMNPWGSPDNHPGIGGKIGHIASVIGNTAGNAVLGPGVMSSIPGSAANLNAKIHGGEEAQKESVEEGAREATTADTEAQIPERAANTEHLKQETKNLENPQLKTVQEQYAKAVQEAQTAGRDPATDPKVQQLADSITSLQKQSATPEQALDKQYNDAITAGDHEKAERILKVMSDVAKAKQPPQRAPITEVVLPGGQVEAARPGMTLPAGTQNIGGFSTMNRPTAQERNVSAQAAIAAQGIPEVVHKIDSLGDQLGPVMGRWNEFMQGKVGMENPEFASLRADLLMASSAVALAHARGRLPENLRQEFDNAINAPKQSPENLKAVLNTILPWMQRMEQIGAVGDNKQSETAQPSGRLSVAEWKAQQAQGGK